MNLPRLPCLLLLAALFGATTGCGVVVRSAAIPLVAVAVAGPSVLAATQDEPEPAVEDDEPDDYEYRDTKQLLDSPAPAPMKADELDGTLPIGQVRAAMAAVDLTQCRAEGAPRGYGHARVTIDPQGLVSRIVIDGPAGMPKSAVACVGDRLGEARVPAYNGEPTTFGTTWFVP